MGATPLDIPEGYRLGKAERYYIARFEELTRQGVPMLPSDFYKRMERAASTFARYRILKRLLNEYGWRTKPEKMRGSTPSLLQKVSLSPDPRIVSLESKIRDLNRRLEGSESAKRKLEEEIKTLRVALMATISHFSSASMSRAVKIEQKLAELYMRVLPESVTLPFVGGLHGRQQNGESGR